MNPTSRAEVPVTHAHRWVLASQAHGGAFAARCRSCGAERLFPQVPATSFPSKTPRRKP